MTFEKYLEKHRREVGTGPLKYLTARECLIGEMLWGAAIAAERERGIAKCLEIRTGCLEKAKEKKNSELWCSAANVTLWCADAIKEADDE